LNSAAAQLSQSEACDALLAFKQQWSLSATRTDDDLSETYRVLLTTCAGEDPQAYQGQVQKALENDAELASSLTVDQQQAWNQLAVASRGFASVQWDRARRTPAWIAFAVNLHGADASEARADFDARFSTLVSSLFGFDGGLVLELVEQASYENCDYGCTKPTRVGRYVYRLRHGDLPVFGGVFDLTVRTGDDSDQLWTAFIAARSLRDAGSLGKVPTISGEAAIEAALESAEVPDGSAAAAPELGICDLEPSPALCYRLVLGNEAGASWTYFVSAANGAILRKADNVQHYDGTLKAYVGRPLEGNAKYARPLPQATIYEDSATYTETVGCGYSTTLGRERGDVSRVLGMTSYSGAYTGLFGFDPSDTSWMVDLRGLYAGYVVRDKPFAGRLHGGHKLHVPADQHEPPEPARRDILSPELRRRVLPSQQHQPVPAAKVHAPHLRRAAAGGLLPESPVVERRGQLHSLRELERLRVHHDGHVRARRLGTSGRGAVFSADDRARAESQCIQQGQSEPPVAERQVQLCARRGARRLRCPARDSIRGQSSAVSAEQQVPGRSQWSYCVR
jgi:hypothetical protein